MSFENYNALTKQLSTLSKDDVTFILQNINTNYTKANAILENEPLEAKELFQKILSDIHILKSVNSLQTFFPEKHEEILFQLNRLSGTIAEKVHIISVDVKLQNKRLSHDEEEDDTQEIPFKIDMLQQEFQRELAELILNPIYFQKMSIHDKLIIVSGPSQSGKSFTLEKTYEYIQKNGIDAEMIFINSFKFEKVSKELFLDGSFKVLVVDHVSMEELKEWTGKSWYKAFMSEMFTNDNLICVINLDGSYENIHNHPSLIPKEVKFELPNQHMIYQYVRFYLHEKLHHQVSLTDVQKTILDDTEGLIFCAKQLYRKQANFQMIQYVLDNAIKLSHSLAVQDNVVLKTNNHYLSRMSINNSKTLKRQCIFSKDENTDEYKLALIKANQFDYIEMEEKDVKVKYWNEFFFNDYLVLEPDRRIELFFHDKAYNQQSYCMSENANSKNGNDEIVDLIMKFPMQMHYYPENINTYMKNILLPFYFSLWLSMWKHERSMDHTYDTETTQIMALFETLLNSMISVNDIKDQSSKIVNLLMTNGEIEKFESHYDFFVRESNYSKQVLIVNLEKSKSPFSLLYNSTKKKPIPVQSLDAESLKNYIDSVVNVKDSCQVLQLKTHNGYEFQIDFIVDLKNELKVDSSDGNVMLLPRVQMLSGMKESIDLVPDYKITNEGDLDILQDKFAEEYRECFRNEEETWLLNDLKDKRHYDALNEFYSKEQKFYLNLYYGLMQLKKEHSSILSKAKTEELNELIEDMQGYIDYFFLLVSYKDDDQINFMMSSNHMQYEVIGREIANVDENVNNVDNYRRKIDLSNQWMKKDWSFWVSPRLFSQLSLIIPAYLQTNSLQEMYKKYLDSNNEQKRNEYIFVHSSISKQELNYNVSLSHMLPKDKGSFQKIFNNAEYLKLFKERIQYSLFHKIMKNMKLIGKLEKKEIKWYKLNESETDAFLTEKIGKNIQEYHNAYNLLSKSECSESIQKILFSIYFSVQETKEIKTKELLSTLLFFDEFNSWTNMYQSFDQVLDITKNIEFLNTKLTYLLNFVYKKRESESGSEKENEKESETLQTSLFSSANAKGYTYRIDQEKNVVAEKDLSKIINVALNKYHINDMIYQLD